MWTVELENIHKKYGAVHALQGISLGCRQNEFLVLLGPSGAGKTSTLKMIAGLESITSGEIYLDGQPIGSVPPGERDIAMVFESYALYPHLSVLENLAFPLKSKTSRLSRTDMEQRIRQTAATLKIEPLLERKPAELSGGQKQRVALGRALVRESKLLLMDEPLSHLDAKLRHHMRRELIRYRRALQTTVVYVTHDYLEALALADRIVVLNQGKIHQIGTPQEVYNTPADTLVASLLGHPRINLIPATVQRTPGGGVSLIFEGGASSWVVPESYLKQIQDRSTLILGVRPQHIRILPPEDGFGMEGEVYVSSYMGTHHLVEVKMGSHTLTAICREADWAIGQKVLLQFPSQHIMLFDRISGCRVQSSDCVAQAES